MAELSKQSIEEFKQIIKEEYGVEYTDEEAWEASRNLVNYFQLLWEMDQKQKRNAKKGEHSNEPIIE